MQFLNNIDLKKNEIQNFRVQNLAAAPSNPVVGQHYYDTTDNTEKVWNGTKWIDALSQGDYTFKNGIVEDENRNVGLTGATKDAIGGVIVGDNIDVEGGKISVKDATKAQKGLIQLATDEEAAAGVEDTKAVTIKQVEAKIQADIAGDIELTDISATAPITFDQGTGVISATYDETPTADSNNLIKSGAVKAGLEAVKNAAVKAVEKKADTTDTVEVTLGDETKTEFTITKVAEATKAAQDEDGNNIKATYATKDEVKDDITLADLSAVGPITYNELTGVIGATYDAVPTAESENLMKSKDIKAALDGVQKGAVSDVKAKAETTDTITVTKDGVETDIKISLVDEAAKLTGQTATIAEINELHEAGAVKADFVKLHGLTATAAEVNELHEAGAVKADFAKLHAITADAAELNVLDGSNATTEDLNKLAAVTATSADINKLDGLTATQAELNVIHNSEVTNADLVKLHAVTVSATQINAIANVDADDLTKLHNVTATADELNILDGATLDVNELNILDGATVTTDELNVLDGITATTAQLNKAAYLDNCTAADLTKLNAITATADELNVITGSEVSNADLVKLHAVTATAEELNQLAGSGVEKADLTKLHAITATAEEINAIPTTYIKLTEKGAANGVATLDENGLVPAAQLPSFVDDVIDILDVVAVAPATCARGDKYFNTTDKKLYTATGVNTWGEGATPEADKIYVNLANNMSYRWSGSALVQIGADKLLGFNGTIEGDGVTSTFNIDHNLGSRNVVFEIYEAKSPYEKVYVQVLHTSTTQLQVVFGAAPAVGDNYNITVIAIG